MPVVKDVFSAYILIGLLYWLMQLALLLRILKTMPVLSKLNPAELVKWPKVSVIMPGRNERDRIEAALRSRLSDDYPNLELIMVEDRSTDATPQIVDRLSAENPRLRVVHIKELPQGWMGKQYAMHKGAQAATGDWLLFSDADVHVTPGALRRIVAHAESRGLDFLAVLPDIWQVKNVFLNLMMCNFVRIILLSTRVWDVENPKKRTGMGVGAFNLVRRKAYEDSPGFEWLKMEAADDAALGFMMKRSGAKCSIANGTGLIGVHFVKTLKEALISSERAGFTNIGDFSLMKLALMAVILILLEWSPFLAFIPAGWTHLRLIGLAMILLSFTTHVAGNIWMKRPLFEAFLWFLATPLNSYGLVRAGVLGKLRGGVYWRGTFYKTQELKQGKRFRL